MCGDNHRVVDPVDAVDHDRRQMWKQNPATALTSHSPESTTPSQPASRKVRQNHLPRPTTDVLGHERVETTWSIALHRLRAESPTTVALLEASAFLAPVDIPFTLFTDHPTLLDEPLQATARAGPDAISDSVSTAVGYSLVRRNSDGFQLHRLVQAVIRHQMTTETHHAVAERMVAVLAAAYPGDPNDPGCWSDYARLAPHVLAIGPLGDHHPDFRRLTLATVEYLNVRGTSQESRRIAQDVFQRWTHILGGDHPDTLAAAANLSAVLAWVDEHDHLLTLSQDTLERSQRILGPDHPVTLRVATEVIFVRAWFGDGEQASALGEDALRRSVRALGPDHPITLRLAANHAFALAP